MLYTPKIGVVIGDGEWFRSLKKAPGRPPRRQPIPSQLKEWLGLDPDESSPVED
jgi:hypothetical protein